MSLSPGARLGPYEVLAPLGAGGMGEVYRARDSKLGRDVALKILPPVFAGDADRLARFEREARVLASLDHPNIGHIYGLEESDGTRALVLALIEGPTLADRIAQGPLPPDEARTIALQIAEAFEYAHDRGVIHRDLKPANIKITPDGVVKVLDFGLAKALEGEEQSTHPGANSPTMLPTMSMGATQPGVILGTAAYISPEQVKGKRADRRSDIWAFGVVLYEMLSAKRPFDGESLGELLANVVKDEPNLDAVPTDLRPLVERCLIKDPRRRVQSFGEARLLLENAQKPATPDVQPPPPPPDVRVEQSKFGWGVAALVAIVAVGVAWLGYRGSQNQPLRITRTSVVLPENVKLRNANGSVPVISPDGRMIAFTASAESRRELWIRSLESLTARPIPGTDNASKAFWSPDSRFVAFADGAKLKKVDVENGSVVSICDATNVLEGSWSKNDVIIFGSFTTELFAVPANGGKPNSVTKLNPQAGEISHRFPWFLPDGHRFLYLVRNRDESRDTVYVGDLESKDISTRQTVLHATSRIAVAPGYLLFGRGQTLMAQPFDSNAAQAKGTPIPVVEPIDSTGNNGQYLFSVANNGTLIYTSGVYSVDFQLTWMDRSGKIQGVLGEPADLQSPAISPDGRTVLVSRRDPKSRLWDLWSYDVRQGSTTRLTFNGRSNMEAVWAPDGRQFAFTSFLDGVARAYVKTATGASQEQPIKSALPGMQPWGWSSDGRFLFTVIQNPKTNFDTWVLPMQSETSESGKPSSVLDTTAQERWPALSPNGKWLAYGANESTELEVYVRTFPAATGKWQISTEGGNRPFWSKDGRELYYLSSNTLMAVEVKSDNGNFLAGTPKALFELDTNTGRVDVNRDGRFLIPAPVEARGGSSITMVQNWQAALKK